MTAARRARRAVPAILRQSPAFRWYWAGQTVSEFGSTVTFLALPLTAILTLHASALQMGVLGAIGGAPALLLALPIGVWADRIRCRPLLAGVAASSAAVLLTVPIAAWMGHLALPQLYVVAFLAEMLSVTASIGRSSYLPVIVPVERLVEANGLLSASGSAAQVAGPGLGGVLVQVLTAPGAILADAVSFVLAAGSLFFVRTPEPRPVRSVRSVRTDIVEGLRVVVSDPILRALAGVVGTFNFFDGVLLAVYVLYLSRELHLSAAVIGLIFGLAGIGGLLAALVTAPVTRRFGTGRTIIGGFVLCSIGAMLVAAAGGPALLAVAVLLAAEGLFELGVSLYAINANALKAAIVPAHLRGRVAATLQVLSRGPGPAGLLLGGFLGQIAGLRPTVLIAGVGTLLCLPWVVASPLRTLQGTGPEPAAAPVTGEVGEALRPGAN
jgi:MFS family permease